jgi:hypothetical protein
LPAQLTVIHKNCAHFHAWACSLPSPPTINTFINVPLLLSIAARSLLRFSIGTVGAASCRDPQLVSKKFKTAGVVNGGARPASFWSRRSPVPG